MSAGDGEFAARACGEVRDSRSSRAGTLGAARPRSPPARDGAARSRHLSHDFSMKSCWSSDRVLCSSSIETLTPP
eukprot:scaffold76630_cov72-Phaeocystis_antarctica.AAC.3